MSTMALLFKIETMQQKKKDFWSIFNLNMLSDILHYNVTKATKMPIMVLLFKIETCKKNPTLLIINLKMFLAILDESHFQKLQKLLPWLYS